MSALRRPSTVLAARRRGTTAWLVALVLVAAWCLAAPSAHAAAPVPAVSTLSLRLGSTTVVYGAKVVVTATLTTASGPVAGAAIQVRERRQGATAFVVVRTVPTSSTGVASTSVVPTAHAAYDVRYLGSASVATSRSVARSVTVIERLRASSARSVVTGHTLTVRGTVAPARSGLVVRVERKSGNAWRLVKSTRTTASGAYAASVRSPSARGFLSYRVIVAGTSRVRGTNLRLPTVDNYTRHTYVVRTRGTITVSMTDFATSAAATYGDARGWKAAHHRFVRVARGGSFTLVMAQAKYLPSYSSVCSVRYSCRVGRNVVINQDRWRWGSKPYTGTLASYRQMVVNHETGHWLGRPHAHCGSRGALAPVMQQQSKSLQGCRPNAWPLASERRAVT